MDNRPIGVFDYGPGGLEAVRLLAEAFPNEEFVYFADDAKTVAAEPYDEAAAHRTEDARCYADFLLSQDVKMIVIACNLMSAFAGEALRRELPVPAEDLLSAGSEMIRSRFPDTDGLGVTVLTTEMAASAGLFGRALTGAVPGAVISEIGCSELFGLLNRSDYSEEEVREVLSHYRDLTGDRPDMVYLACTRFAAVAETISEQMGGVPVIDPNQALPAAVRKLLDQSGQHSAAETRSIRIFTTGEPEKMEAFAKRILGADIHPEVQRVQLHKELL